MTFTLLWVEDDPNDILLGKRALLKCGFPPPVIVRDGEEAVAYLSGHGRFENRAEFPMPSLVLTDLKLPRLSGLDMIRWMRDRDGLRRIPVVVLTSSKQRSDVDAAYDCGANSYLVKPIEMGRLAELFKSLHSFWVTFNTAPEVTLQPTAN